MSQDQDTRDRSEGELRQFEKNRFFQGKLMTARDMETEQEYHARRLNVMNRFATGRGILSGLEISELEERDTELEVTIEPGVVIDGYGRPIVVEHTTTKTLPTPSGDELYLFFRYEESDLESVPVPEVRGATNEEYMSNRAVESFELTYQESPPDEYGEIPAFDTSVDDPEDEKALLALGNRFHQRYRTPTERRDDPSVFVGAFERTRDGSWIPGEETVRRHMVYDNDMLYAALMNHITDTENPHGMSVESGTGDLDMELDEVEGVSQQIRIMSDQLETLNRYVMRKSLKDTIRFFDGVADRFEDQMSEGSRIIQDVVKEAEKGVKDDVYDDPEAYRDHVGDMLELDINLGEALEDVATKESLEQYVTAVNELQEALASQANVLTVAETQDQVCEAADSLEVLYDIVPEN